MGTPHLWGVSGTLQCYRLCSEGGPAVCLEVWAAETRREVTGLTSVARVQLDL